LAEKTAIPHVLEQQPGVGIVDNQKTAMRVPIAERVFPISCGSWIGEEQIAQNEQQNEDHVHDQFSPPQRLCTTFSNACVRN
jgi:hypothetical protein